MSDSLGPYGLQNIRLPCPSSSPGACSNLRPLSRWCHPNILSSVIPFSSWLSLSSIRLFSNESGLHIRCQRFDAFELCCWKRLLRVPWSARRSNQSIVKEIKPGYSLKGLMLKLKLQYFGYLMWRPDSLEKSLMLEKLSQEEKGITEDKMFGWHHRLNGRKFEQAPGDDEGQGSLMFCSP